MGDSPDEAQKIFYSCISIGLVLLAGLMSGLTLGLMSLDSVDLEVRMLRDPISEACIFALLVTLLMQVLIRSGTAKEKKYAARITPVISKPHHTLVTLLLCNAVCLEALPIFLDRLVDPVAAVVLSVTVVLFFGEIVPQAICSHYGLAIGAYTAWFVRFLMWTTAIISWPISKLLDYLLGSEHTALFRRGQLKALVDLHSETEGLGGQLAAEEINVIRGALDLTNKTAAAGMTPIDKVKMLPADATLDEDALRGLLKSGHSRIPVHRPGSRKEILGIVLVKELVLVDTHAQTRVADLRIRSLPYLRADIAMYDLLKLFQTGRSHMVVLTKPPEPAPAGNIVRASSQEVTVQVEEAKDRLSPSKQPELNKVQPPEPGKAPSSPNDIEDGEEDGDKPSSSTMEERWPAVKAAQANEPVGIITIEDVLEELIGTEIVDETDQFVDNEMQQAVNSANLVRDLPDALRNSLKLRKGLSRTRSGNVIITPEGTVMPAPKPSPRRVLSDKKPSSQVTMKRKTGADNQTMDILEPLMQGSEENV